MATRARELSAASDQAVKLPGVAADSPVTDWITAVAAVVAAVGTGAAAIAAWLAARASAAASREASDALVRQTEREAALEADATLRALEVDAQDSTVWPSRLGTLHNRWQDGAAIPAMRLRDAETRRRVQVVGDVLFLAMQAATNEHTSFALLAAVEDARAALDAFLKNGPHHRPVSLIAGGCASCARSAQTVERSSHSTNGWLRTSPASGSSRRPSGLTSAVRAGPALAIRSSSAVRRRARRREGRSIVPTRNVVPRHGTQGFGPQGVLVSRSACP